jgi:hypothetical protein
MMDYEQLEKHVAAFLRVMRSTETYRNIDDVLCEVRVPEDDAAEVTASLERETLIARPDKAPRLVTLTHWGKKRKPRKR